jgi:hypothetical protein
MRAFILVFVAACLSFNLIADDQLTVHKVTLAGTSGTVNGKVIGLGDYLIFVDDDQPAKSFFIPRGEIRSAASNNGAIVVEMSRPVTDRFGTRSNLELRLVDPASATVFTKWIGVPVERARTVTSYSLDVRHDHQGQGGCNGKLIADENRLRFESVGQADHSRSWEYNGLSRFEVEKDNSIIKVTPSSGDAYHLNVANGATAGAMHTLVSGKIVAARPSR